MVTFDELLRKKVELSCYLFKDFILCDFPVLVHFLNDLCSRLFLKLHTVLPWRCQYVRHASHLCWVSHFTRCLSLGMCHHDITPLMYATLWIISYELSISQKNNGHFLIKFDVSIPPPATDPITSATCRCIFRCSSACDFAPSLFGLSFISWKVWALPFPQITVCLCSTPQPMPLLLWYDQS